MQSRSIDTANALMSSKGGGVANISTAKATATITSTTETVLGGPSGSRVNIGGDVSLTADSNPAAVSRYAHVEPYQLALACAAAMIVAAIWERNSLATGLPEEKRKAV